MSQRKIQYLFMSYLMLLIMMLPSAAALTVDDSEVFILEAPEHSVYFIYADFTKGPGSHIDWTATGYIKGLTRNTQFEKLSSDGNVIDQTTRAPLISDEAIIMSGGPIVQKLVGYYESNRIAPVYFGDENGLPYFYKKDGVRIDETGIMPSNHEDVFVIEHFLDNSGNAVLIIYGYGGLGTFAGARLFKSVIYPNIRSYTHSYYIYHWFDDNGDCFPDLNEIDSTPIACGD